MDHVHRKVKLTPVSVFHYVRLVYRSLLFLGLFALYLSCRLRGGEDVLTAMEKRPMILVLIWAVFTTEMILRFFPSGLESPGCQKQFARNYIKTGKTHIEMHENNATVLVALMMASSPRTSSSVFSRMLSRERLESSSVVVKVSVMGSSMPVDLVTFLGTRSRVACRSLYL